MVFGILTDICFHCYSTFSHFYTTFFSQKKIVKWLHIGNMGVLGEPITPLLKQNFVSFKTKSIFLLYIKNSKLATDIVLEQDRNPLFEARCQLFIMVYPWPQGFPTLS